MIYILFQSVASIARSVALALIALTISRVTKNNFNYYANMLNINNIYIYSEVPLSVCLLGVTVKPLH